MAKVNKKEMASYQFTLILTGIKDLTPDVTDALYEAGFDDALVGMAGRVPYIDVNHRRAESLENAVRCSNLALLTRPISRLSASTSAIVS